MQIFTWAVNIIVWSLFTLWAIIIWGSKLNLFISVTPSWLQIYCGYRITTIKLISRLANTRVFSYGCTIVDVREDYLNKFYYSGTVELRIQDSMVSLFADEEHSIIGKALVIHEGIGMQLQQWTILKGL